MTSYEQDMICLDIVDLHQSFNGKNWPIRPDFTEHRREVNTGHLPTL